jgi:hypothetical protein
MAPVISATWSWTSVVGSSVPQWYLLRILVASPVRPLAISHLGLSGTKKMKTIWKIETRPCSREGIFQLHEFGMSKVPYVDQAATIDPTYYAAMMLVHEAGREQFGFIYLPM